MNILKTSMKWYNFATIRSKNLCLPNQPTHRAKILAKIKASLKFQRFPMQISKQLCTMMILMKKMLQPRRWLWRKVSQNSRKGFYIIYRIKMALYLQKIRSIITILTPKVVLRHQQLLLRASSLGAIIGNNLRTSRDFCILSVVIMRPLLCLDASYVVFFIDLQ